MISKEPNGIGKNDVRQFAGNEGRTELIDNLTVRMCDNEERLEQNNYSSDRMPYYKKEYDEQCAEFLRVFSVEQFPFLQESFNDPNVNKRFDLTWKKILSMTSLSHENSGLLSTLDVFFTEPKNVSNYEGVFNTLNYIKNYIYYCLDKSESLDIFKDYDYKKVVVKAILPTIVEYLRDIKKDTELQLSIGKADLLEPESPYFNEEMIVSAVAFGTTYENLVNHNYTEAERLLFLPRTLNKNDNNKNDNNNIDNNNNTNNNNTGKIFVKIM